MMKPLNETEIARLAALDIFTKIDQGTGTNMARNPNYKLLRNVLSNRCNE